RAEHAQKSHLQNKIQEKESAIIEAHAEKDRGYPFESLDYMS
ncbi:MAG: hypothetical protein ACI8YB_002142, partial [Patiriisocius sp.]